MASAFINEYEPVFYLSKAQVPPAEEEHKQNWLKMRRYEYYQRHKKSVDLYGVVSPDMLMTDEEVTELRTSWSNVTTVDEKAELNNQLSNNLKTIMAVSENYPDLKANQNFLDMQEELRNTENKISFSRQFYNDTVTMYNTKLEIFPSNIIAGWFKFTSESLFAAESEEARKNVKVDFNN